MLFNECISVKIKPKELIVFFCVSLEREVWFLQYIAISNTIECNNNASQKGVSTVCIIHGQFVGVNKPSRLNAY